MHDVFISYSHRDKVVADAVCAKLEGAQIRCWIAPRDVLPGARWGAAIVGGINGARVVVLILSEHSNQSSQVLNEVERAVSRGVPLLPIRIDDILPSEDLELFVSSSHWLDAVTPPFEDHLQRLVVTVQALLKMDKGPRRLSDAASNEVDGEAATGLPIEELVSAETMVPVEPIVIESPVVTTTEPVEPPTVVVSKETSIVDGAPESTADAKVEVSTKGEDEAKKQNPPYMVYGGAALALLVLVTGGLALIKTFSRTDTDLANPSVPPKVAGKADEKPKVYDDSVFRVQDVQKLWSVSLPGIRSTPTIGKDGTIYVSSMVSETEGSVYAVSPDGNLKWTFNAGESLPESVAVGEDGTVYAGSMNGRLFAIDKDGHKRWDLKLAVSEIRQPAIDTQGNIYTAYDGGTLYAVSPSGTKVWEYKSSSTSSPAPVLSDSGEIFFVPERTIYVLNKDGTVKQNFPTQTNNSFDVTLGSDGAIYLHGIGNITALSSSGSLLWDTGYGSHYNKPIIGPVGELYVGSTSEKSAYRLDTNGKVEWKYDLGEDVWSAPGIDTDGNVYFATAEHYLYAFSGNGKLKWRYSVPARTIQPVAPLAYNPSPAVSPDGTVYVVSRDNALIAVK